VGSALGELAQAFFIVEHAFAFYPEGHQARRAPLARFTEAMTGMLADRGLTDIHFAEEGLRWEGEAFGDLPVSVRKLVDRFRTQGIAGVSWTAGLSSEEAGGLVERLLERRGVEGSRREHRLAFPHLDIEEVDYSSLVARAGAGEGEVRRERWRDLLRQARRVAEVDLRPEDQALLGGQGDDPAALAAAMMGGAAAAGGEETAEQVRSLRRVVDAFGRAGGGETRQEAIVDRLRLAAARLPEEMRFALLDEVLDAPAESLFAQAFGALPPEELIRLLARNFALDPGRIIRLTRVFQRLVPRRLDRLELAPLLRELLQDREKPEETLAENTCEEVEELLTGEAGDFMSPSYRAMLHRLAEREEHRLEAEHLIARLVEIESHLDPRHTADDLLRVRTEYLPLATSPDRFREGLALLVGICRGALAAGDLARGTATLGRLSRLRREETDAERLREFAAVFRELGSSGAIGDLLLAYPGVGAEERESIREVVLAACPPPVPRLLELLAAAREAGQRSELLGLLVSLGRVAVAPVLARLDAAAPEEAVVLLALLGTLRDPSAGPGLLALLRREHPRLRREALRTLIGLDSPEVRRALSVFLLDADEEIARLVADHLGARDDCAAADVLMSHLACGLFAGVRAEEMKRAILALGRMRTARAVRPLAELLRRRTWVSRRTQEEIQAAAAQALWRIGGDEARGALERSATQTSASVAALCHRLLARVETP
jgi:hypothetical protein